MFRQSYHLYEMQSRQSELNKITQKTETNITMDFFKVITDCMQQILWTIMSHDHYVKVNIIHQNHATTRKTLMQKR